MKKYSVSLILFLLLTYSYAQNIVEVESKPTKVTLFLAGAQIHREAKVNLQKGSNVVKLVGLRQNLSANSIIVEGSTNFVIVSVEHKYNYLRKAQDLAEYKEMQQQAKKLYWDIRKIEADKLVLDEETSVLQNNQSIKGEQETMNIERLIDYTDVYQDKQVDILIKRNDLSKKEKEARIRLQKLNSQLQEVERINNKNTSEIWVTLNATSNTTTNLKFNYYTTEAYWKPFYDIRTTDENAAVDFVLKGKLNQSTGETWEKVYLTLSTGNPSLTANLPTLNPWSIYAVKPQKYRPGKGHKKARSMAYSPAYDNNEVQSVEKDAEKLEEVSLEYAKPLATAKNNLTTVEYAITDAYTLPGDNQFYDIDVITSQTNGLKTFYTAPGYEEKAYTLVEMPDWTKLNLLNGEAAMYYNDNYVGKVYLNTENVEDTLSLSFGPDQNVLVKRRLVYEKERSQIAGSNRLVSRTVEISIRNSKNLPVELDVEDQIPVAYNKNIVVEKIDFAGAEYDSKTGFLAWKIKLEPGETKRIVFKYKVKYPKSSVISKF